VERETAGRRIVALSGHSQTSSEVSRCARLATRTIMARLKTPTAEIASPSRFQDHVGAKVDDEGHHGRRPDSSQLERTVVVSPDRLRTPLSPAASVNSMSPCWAEVSTDAPIGADEIVSIPAFATSTTPCVCWPDTQFCRMTLKGGRHQAQIPRLRRSRPHRAQLQSARRVSHAASSGDIERPFSPHISSTSPAAYWAVGWHGTTAQPLILHEP
jgi:hypothetical protein